MMEDFKLSEEMRNDAINISQAQDKGKICVPNRN